MSWAHTILRSRWSRLITAALYVDTPTDIDIDNVFGIFEMTDNTLIDDWVARPFNGMVIPDPNLYRINGLVTAVFKYYVPT